MFSWSIFILFVAALALQVSAALQTSFSSTPYSLRWQHHEPYPEKFIFLNFSSVERQNSIILQDVLYQESCTMSMSALFGSLVARLTLMVTKDGSTADI